MVFICDVHHKKTLFFQLKYFFRFVALINLYYKIQCVFKLKRVII